MKKKTEYKKALLEAVKEPLRLLVLSVVPVAIAYFAELDYQWAALAVVLLKLVDSVLHEVGKEAKNDILTLGLARF